jgi:hypothetical protein
VIDPGSTPLVVWFAGWNDSVNYFCALYRLPNGEGQAEYRWSYPGSVPRWFTVRSKLSGSDSIADLRRICRECVEEFRRPWEDMPPADVLDEVEIPDGDVLAALACKEWVTVLRKSRPRRVRR